MTQIYFCDMKKFGHLYEECISLLPEKRREKAERIINKNEALLSAVTGLMMKEKLGADKDGIIKLGEHGKPFIEHGPCFSVSHSRQYAVLAVSDGEIGIDIEMHMNPDERIAKRCFSDDEQAFAKMSTENFLRIWTAKEAVLKFIGTGFSWPPKNFSVLPLEEEHIIKERKIRFFCHDINGAVLTAAYCDENDFEISELLPEDLIY